MDKYGKWIKQDFEMPSSLKAKRKRRPGRPQKSGFDDISLRTKERRTESLRRSFLLEELSFAASSSIGTRGKRTTTKLLIEATQTTPTRGKKIWDKYRSSSVKGSKFTEDEALSLFVEAKYTKFQYNVLRRAMLSC